MFRDDRFALLKRKSIHRPTFQISQLVVDFAEMQAVHDKARVCRNASEISQLQEGEILVSPTTSPSWAPVFAKIGACVTDVGGVMSHAAIVCREYGLPAIVGTGHATKIIKTGMQLHVDGSTGIVTIER